MHHLPCIIEESPPVCHPRMLGCLQNNKDPAQCTFPAYARAHAGARRQAQETAVAMLPATSLVLG